MLRGEQMKNVLPLGTKVKFGKEKEYVGEITKIILTLNGIEISAMYAVCYWMEDEFKSIELPESELHLIEITRKVKIGFDANKSN